MVKLGTVNVPERQNLKASARSAGPPRTLPWKPNLRSRFGLATGFSGQSLKKPSYYRNRRKIRGKC